MIFMCLMDYAEPATVAQVRPEHRQYMFSLIRADKVIVAGSFRPDDDGGLFLYEAQSLDEARRLVNDDPYVKRGAIRSYRLREYETHGVNAALLRVTG